jgi:hypothetical protein
VGLRAWLHRPLLLYVLHIERKIQVTNAEVLAQLATIQTGVNAIGDAVVALEAAVAAAGTTPEVDAAIATLATSVGNIVATLPQA